MTNRLQIYKLNSLPIAEEIEPNSIYLIPYGLEHLDMYVSNNDGLELKRIINTSDLVDYQTTENLVTEILVKSDTTYPSTKAVMDAIDVGADALGSAEAVETLLQPQIDNLSSNKLDAVDYVQHFRGLFSSYTALSDALPTALDGDYAHIDSGTGFDRMVVVWDSSDNAWVINEVGVASNTDEISEGSSNLYFTGERVRQTPLTGMVEQTATPILSTDQLLAALAKLQAQIDNPPPIVENGFNWVAETTVGNKTSSVWNRPSSKLYFAKKDGMLWVKGYLHCDSSISHGTEFFNITNPLYDVNTSGYPASPSSKALGLLSCNKNPQGSVSISITYGVYMVLGVTLSFRTTQSANDIITIPPSIIGELLNP